MDKQEILHLCQEAKAAFGKDEHQFYSKGLQIEVWTRGGEPGPDYISETLTLVADGKKFTGTLIKGNFILAPKPYNVIEKYEGFISGLEIDDLMKFIFQKDLLVKDFPEESDRQLAGGLKTDVIFKWKNKNFEKHFFHPLGNDIEKLVMIIEHIQKLLISSGAKTETKRPVN